MCGSKRKAVKMSGQDWASWDRFEWNNRLLDFYFGKQDGIRMDPVSIIEVSSAALARVAGASKADQIAVRDSFVGLVRQMLVGGSSRQSLMAHAKKSGKSERGPNWFVHLVVTCLAAAEPLEDTDVVGEIEHDFRQSLVALLGYEEATNNLELLPRLWEALRDWLLEQGAESQFRKLELPDPGNETIIGYSKRLAFPKVRDLEILMQALNRADLLFGDVPHQLVISNLQSRRPNFHQDMHEAFEEFVILNNQGADSGTLFGHRFWAAVNSAIQSEPLQTQAPNSDNRISLIGYDDELDLIIVTQEERPFNGITPEPSEDLPSPWTHFVPTGHEDKNPIATILGAGFRSPLQRMVAGGVLPFLHGSRDSFGLTRGYRIEETAIALVRQEVIEDLRDIFSIRAPFKAHSLDGWFTVVEPGLYEVPASSLIGTTLERTFLLYSRLRPNQLHISSDFAFGTTFLGFKGFHPLIKAPNSVAMEAVLDGSPIAASRSNEHWTLPNRDLFGHLRVDVEFINGGTLTREITLVDQPDRESYKDLGDSARWMAETNGGVSPWAAYLNANRAQTEADIPEALETVFLGREIGEFVEQEADAFWKVVRYGSHGIGELLRPDGNATPDSWARDRSTRTKWRKLLDPANRCWDSETKSRLRAIHAMRGLVPSDFEIPDSVLIQNLNYPEPSPKWKIVAAALGTNCCREIGMDWRTWSSLLRSQFGVTAFQMEQVHRGWLEGGFIDHPSSTRWSGVRIMARQPIVWLFRSGQSRFGSVEGLLMPNRLRSLELLAAELGLSHSLNLSPSPFVPPRMVVSSVDYERIEEFARRANLTIQFLSATPDLTQPIRESATETPPINYQVRARAGETFRPHDSAKIRSFYRPDGDSAPYWLTSFGDQEVWSYSRAAIDGWSDYLAGEKSWETSLGHEITAATAFLPLSAARWLAAVSGTPPGPRFGPKPQYVNVASSRESAQTTLSAVSMMYRRLKDKGQQQ